MKLPNKAPDFINELAAAVGGKVEEVGGPLPDGSGFAVMSMPLRKDHWIYQTTEDGFTPPPPMPFRIGAADAPVLNRTRAQWAEGIRAACRYAVQASTMRGQEMDFDPDAMVQNMVVGMLGYWTPDGLSSDSWANPKEPGKL